MEARGGRLRGRVKIRRKVDFNGVHEKVGKRVEMRQRLEVRTHESIRASDSLVRWPGASRRQRIGRAPAHLRSGPPLSCRKAVWLL